MPLVHGQEIGAAEIEHEISGWDAERFARLCNAVAWASTWQTAQALPAFTERVNVADNGKDAQWQGELAAEAIAASPLLTTGVNVFQYKKREVTEQTRRRLVTNMAGELHGAILDIERHSGTRLNGYVFFTNIDLTPEQHEQLCMAIADGLTDVHARIGIVGAADLAAMLNQLPHLRSAFFATAAFRTWGESWEEHTQVFAFPQAALTGRAEALEMLRNYINDDAVRVVAISGTHMMGKTRLVLEAIRNHDASFVEALDRHGLTIDQLRRLESAGRSAVVLVNDPDTELAQRLVNEALPRTGLKLILCVATAEAAPAPSFGRDPRVRHLPLDVLSGDESRQLFRSINADLDFGAEVWILENAGGVPGVILAAAHVGPGLRREGGSFLDQVADAFEREVRGRLTEGDQSALSALALMSHVGIGHNAAGEIESACAHFNIDLNASLNAIDRLKAAGFIRIDGSYAEVVPPPLANRLAACLIRGRAGAVAALFAALSEPARHRFLRRLVLLRGEEANRFWDELLSDGGPLASLRDVIANSKLFCFAAAANGARAGPILHRLLEEQPVEQRRAIAGRARRDLVHAIEEILFRDGMSEIALRALVLLAEAENETWSNNASGVFKEAFYPMHPQMPLPLPRRLAMLRELVGPTKSHAIACLAVEASAGIVEGNTAVVLRHSAAALPLGHRPEMRGPDIWQYQGDSIDLLAAASTDARPEVARAAAARLPRALTNFVSRGHHQRGMPHLQAVVDKVLAGDTLFKVSALADCMTWCRRAFRDDAHGGAEANAEVIHSLTQLLTRLQTAGFTVRMRLWVGGWSLDLDNAEAPAAASNAAIAALAQEACDNPELLIKEIVHWLCTEADQSGRFWGELGRHDENGSFRVLIRDLGTRQEGARGFMAYISGWCARDEQAGREFFAQAAGDDMTTPRAVLFGALEIDQADVGADRIVALIIENRLQPLEVDAILAGRWLQQVSEAALVRVLAAITGPDMENGPQIPKILGYRLLHNRRLVAGALTDFAWRYLEAHPVMGQYLGDYYCDKVAARLASLNPDRAFALLDRCIRDERPGERWNPLDSQPKLAFWKELSRIDRHRALVTVLDAAGAEGEARWTVEWHLPAVVDIEGDAQFLGEYAARGEAEGLTVAHAITGGRRGFWPLAFRLIDLYPRRDVLRHELEHRVEQRGQFVEGPYSEHFRRCRDDIAHVRQLPVASAPVRAWLDDYDARLERALQEQRRREADERVNRN